MQMQANARKGSIIRDFPHSDDGNVVGSPRYYEVVDDGEGYRSCTIREVSYAASRGRVVDYLGRPVRD